MESPAELLFESRSPPSSPIGVDQAQEFSSLTSASTSSRVLEGLQATGQYHGHEQESSTSSFMFHCPRCSRGFRIRGDLTRHIVEKHERQRRFICPACYATFTRSTSLSEHWKRSKSGSACRKTLIADEQNEALRGVRPSHPDIAPPRQFPAVIAVSHRTLSPEGQGGPTDTAALFDKLQAELEISQRERYELKIQNEQLRRKVREIDDKLHQAESQLASLETTVQKMQQSQNYQQQQAHLKFSVIERNLREVESSPHNETQSTPILATSARHFSTHELPPTDPKILAEYQRQLQLIHARDRDATKETDSQSHNSPMRIVELQAVKEDLERQLEYAQSTATNSLRNASLLRAFLESDQPLSDEETADIGRLVGKLPRLLCSKCDDYPRGFRGEHELTRHMQRAHNSIRHGWVCIDASDKGDFLVSCRKCQNKKVYGAYYNAAAHLRRVHFIPKQLEEQRAAGISVASKSELANWPAIDELKSKWMKEVTLNADGRPVEEGLAGPSAIEVPSDSDSSQEGEAADQEAPSTSRVRRR